MYTIFAKQLGVATGFCQTAQPWCWTHPGLPFSFLSEICTAISLYCVSRLYRPHVKPEASRVCEAEGQVVHVTCTIEARAELGPGWFAIVIYTVESRHSTHRPITLAAVSTRGGHNLGPRFSNGSCCICDHSHSSARAFNEKKGGGGWGVGDGGVVLEFFLGRSVDPLSTCGCLISSCAVQIYDSCTPLHDWCIVLQKK